MKTPPCYFLEPSSQSILEAKLNPSKRQHSSHTLSMAKGGGLHQSSATLLVQGIDGVKSWMPTNLGHRPGVVSSTGNVQSSEPMFVLAEVRISKHHNIFSQSAPILELKIILPQYLCVGIELGMEEQKPSHSIVPPSNLVINETNTTS